MAKGRRVSLAGIKIAKPREYPVTTCDQCGWATIMPDNEWISMETALGSRQIVKLCGRCKVSETGRQTIQNIALAWGIDMSEIPLPGDTE